MLTGCLSGLEFQHYHTSGHEDEELNEWLGDSLFPVLIQAACTVKPAAPQQQPSDYRWWCWLGGGCRWRWWPGFLGSGRQHGQTGPGSPPLGSGRGSPRSDGWCLERRKIVQLVPVCQWTSERFKVLSLNLQNAPLSAACDVTKGTVACPRGVTPNHGKGLRRPTKTTVSLQLFSLHIEPAVKAQPFRKMLQTEG